MTETTCGHQPYKAKGLCNKCYMREWHGPPKPRPELLTTCGHEPYYAKSLCQFCYNAAWAVANREHVNARTREWRAENAERHRAMQRAWREANAEHKAKYAKEWAAANPEQVARKRKEWRDANKERSKGVARQWQATNRDKLAVYVNRRRARKMGLGADLTTEQWAAVLGEFQGHCAYCDRTDLALQQEHMIPLSRGGLHTLSNVVPACIDCNYRKHMQTALEFAGWVIPPRRQRGSTG